MSKRSWILSSPNMGFFERFRPKKEVTQQEINEYVAEHKKIALEREAEEKPLTITPLMKMEAEVRERQSPPEEEND